MTLDKVNIMFEDGNFAEVDGKFVGQIIVDKITKSVRRIADGSVQSVETAGAVVLEIHSDGNTPVIIDAEGNTLPMFERLANISDITAVEVFTRDITSVNADVYFTDWRFSTEGNKNQQVYISELGHLYMVIEKDASVFTYFDKDIIDGRCDTE